MPLPRIPPPGGLARTAPWVLLATLLATVGLSRAPIETADSELYRLLAERAGPLELLASTRTPGYPLLLRGVGAVCPDLSCLPAVQLVLHGLAAAALGASLFGAGLSRLASVAAAGLALADPWVWNMAPLLRNDLPALSLAVAALAALLQVLSAPGPFAWAALTLTSSATWLMRPAYLFLLPLMIGVGWLWCRLPVRSTSAGPSPTRLAARLSLATFGPLLLWCLLRLVTVGHFGPVSFTGFNLIGVTASWLDDEQARGLPPREARLAREILQLRRQLALEPVDQDTPIAIWWSQFDANAWRAGARSARRLASRYLARTRPPDQVALLLDVEADRRLVRLSLALIRAQPALYGRWLFEGWASALRRLARDPLVLVPGSASLAGWLAWTRVRRRRSDRASPPGLAATTSRAWLGVAVAFYLGGGTLALAVEPPEPRYLEAVTLLLPGALAAGAIEIWRSVLARERRIEGAEA
ncbi:MAG TPA: hypothetical protein VF017_14350 [Thermoanaerobaculia bacterium]|nr:hypothetical protein [Thermoanaerobaculia bacterium]